MPGPWLPNLRSGAAAALAIAGGMAVPPALIGNPAQASVVLPVQGGCQVGGPFPTMRRANDVAEQARRNGYTAIAFHNGDGYYVRACR